MNKKLVAYLAIGIIATTYSCAPIYKCGEEKPERPIAGSNRLLDVVNERDELCDMLTIKEEETNYLVQRNQSLTLMNDSLETVANYFADNYGKLQTKYDDLNEQHNSLRRDQLELSQKFSDEISKNLSQGHLYDERLKEQERRLALKEQELENTSQEIAAREGRIRELEGELARQDSIAKRLNNLLREALLGFDSEELTTEIKNGKVYVSMSDKLMFQSGKASVQTKGKDALRVLAEVLKKNKDFHILVEGHTDNVPIKTNRYADNWDLSVDRATSIVRILQNDYNIDPLRLTASGKGEFFPRATNESADGRAKNRRTEIILSPNLSELMDFIGK